MDKKTNCQLENKEDCATVGTITIIMAVMVGVPFLCFLWVCYHARKEKLDQENLEMIERQDQVIKTYQRPSKVCSSQYYRRGFTACVSLNIS